MCQAHDPYKAINKKYLKAKSNMGYACIEAEIFSPF